MKLLIDMNLSPIWVEYFAQHGVEALHWSTVGDPRAKDETIMDHARQQGMVVFTHELDFGNILAVTHARGPSVIQVRTEDPVPEVIGELVVSSIREYEPQLDRGALLTIEPQSVAWATSSSAARQSMMVASMVGISSRCYSPEP